MRRSRGTSAGSAIVALAILAAVHGCADKAQNAVPGTPIVETEGGWPQGGFGDTACGVCVRSTCQRPVTACTSDPSCAVALACVLGCPARDDSSADPECESACPSRVGSTAQNAWSSLMSCRGEATPGSCAASCGVAVQDASDASQDNPILHQSCSPSTQTDVCKKCDEERCCETSNACTSNPDCKSLMGCINACPDQGFQQCSDGCVSKAPTEAVAARYRRMACLVLLCSNDCVGPNSCSDCVLSQCGNTAATCYEDRNCFERWFCQGACPAVKNQACLDQCASKYPDSTGFYQQLAACLSSHCATICG